MNGKELWHAERALLKWISRCLISAKQLMEFGPRLAMLCYVMVLISSFLPKASKPGALEAALNTDKWGLRTLLFFYIFYSFFFGTFFLFFFFRPRICHGLWLLFLQQILNSPDCWSYKKLLWAGRNILGRKSPHFPSAGNSSSFPRALAIENSTCWEQNTRERRFCWHLLR